MRWGIITNQFCTIDMPMPVDGRALEKEKEKERFHNFKHERIRFWGLKKVEVFPFVVDDLGTVRKNSKWLEKLGPLGKWLALRRFRKHHWLLQPQFQEKFWCKDMKEWEEIWPVFTTCSWSEHYSIDSDYEYEINKKVYLQISEI